MRANRLGDAFSKKESLKILEKVCEDYDAPSVALRDGVSSLYAGRLAQASAKQRKSFAEKQGIKGKSFYVDNVGRVRDSPE